MKSPFDDWLMEVISDSILIDPDNMLREAQDNQWSFSITEKQAKSLSVEDVVHFLKAVIDSRQEWLLENDASAMKFYCWNDKQAGQLRFSMVSDIHDKLPFAGKIVSVNLIDVVIVEWLNSATLEGISLSSYEEVQQEIDSHFTTVWSVLLPQNG